MTWPRRLLIGALLAVFAAFAVFMLYRLMRAAHGNSLAFNDFFAQWSFGRFLHVRVPVTIYDSATLHRFQLGLEPSLHQQLPFPYPPSYMFVSWPLAFLPFGIAYVLWIAVTLSLFLWAVSGAGSRFLDLAFAALAPATIIVITYGQNGLLTSGLIVAGCRFLGRRNVMAGILFGLATVKPQIGLLIPFALAAAGQWRAMLAAAVTALLLIVASGAVFGWSSWPAWLAVLPAHADYVDRYVNNYYKPTIMANLMLFGVAPPLARMIHLAVAGGVIFLVWTCFRRGLGDLSIAALQAGTCLAVPYTFLYDLPMLTSAVLLVWRGRRDRPLGLIGSGILAAALLFPAVVTLTTRFFYVSSVALLLLFALILHRIFTPAPRVAMETG